MNFWWFGNRRHVRCCTDRVRTVLKVANEKRPNRRRKLGLYKWPIAHKDFLTVMGQCRPLTWSSDCHHSKQRRSWPSQASDSITVIVIIIIINRRTGNFMPVLVSVPYIHRVLGFPHKSVHRPGYVSYPTRRTAASRLTLDWGHHNLPRTKTGGLCPHPKGGGSKAGDI
jgi:hypothetical protein